MSRTILKHDGGNITAQFEIKEVNNRFFIYKSGNYSADATSEKLAINKLKKILRVSGLTPLGEMQQPVVEQKAHEAVKTVIKPMVCNTNKQKEKALQAGFGIEVNSLLEGRKVEVGYRSSCGKTDVTQKNYRVFYKFIQSLRKSGMNISETAVKHDNAYATNKGGFWNSYIFIIA
jgi:hypothetical protein